MINIIHSLYNNLGKNNYTYIMIITPRIYNCMNVCTINSDNNICKSYYHYYNQWVIIYSVNIYKKIQIK